MLLDQIDFQARRFFARADLVMRQHPRAVSAGVLALLLGSGITAYGVATPATVDPDEVATRVLQHEVALADLTPQLQALEEQALELHRGDLTRSADTADSLLQRLGIHDPDAARFLRQDPVAQRILMGRPGKLAQARGEEQPGGSRLLELVVRGPAADSADLGQRFTRWTVRRTASGFEAHSEQVALGHEVRQSAGTISSSLFAAADEVRLPDAVTTQMADIFGADIDFRRELRKGDTFAVIYETPTADGEPITWTSGTGRVLSARFVNAGQVHEAIWFEAEPGRGGYYGPDGRSKARLFLSSPLAFSRVSSGFAMRFHPILKQWRAHLGVDYAAPTGTAVRSVADGSVSFAGSQNGYGNVVMIDHGGNRTTVYAHLSRIDVARGARISQGQTLGAVGSTGWATGPHLHFEIKVGGAQVDPVKVARASEAVQLAAAARPRFDAQARVAREQLAAAERPGVDLARME